MSENERRNLRRKENYDQLRKVGYSSHFSTTYKDRERRVVKLLVQVKSRHNEALKDDIESIIGGQVRGDIVEE